MMANSLQDWFRRYWLWFLLGLAVVLVVVTALFPSKKDDKQKLVNEANEKAKQLKVERDTELTQLTEKMESRINELIEIKAIKDEDERLKALADFANRRRGAT